MRDAADQGVEQRLFFLTRQMAFHRTALGDVVKACTDLAGLTNPPRNDFKNPSTTLRCINVKFLRDRSCGTRGTFVLPQIAAKCSSLSRIDQFEKGQFSAIIVLG